MDNNKFLVIATTLALLLMILSYKAKPKRCNQCGLEQCDCEKFT